MLPNIHNSLLNINSQNLESERSDYKPVKTEYETDGFRGSRKG